MNTPLLAARESWVKIPPNQVFAFWPSNVWDNLKSHNTTEQLPRSGRKRVLALTELAVGVCCLTLAAVPKDQTALILVVFLLGNLLCTANFTLCWFMSTDFYPTNLRSQGGNSIGLILAKKKPLRS